jgi:mono/diheme cytochrome c family protein
MRNKVLAAAALIACAAVPFVVVAAQDTQSGLQQAQGRAQADTGIGRYYTAAQAVRGKELFNRHCGYCHYVDPAHMPTMTGIRGGALGPRMILHTADDIARYPSAYYLFKRLEYMPPNDVDSITAQQRADILAYILQENGLLPGTSELLADYNAMKAMPLPVEPGFVHVFNGRDFTGWQFLLGYHCTAPPEGCGRTDPGTIFFIKDGVLATSGKMHGMVYLTKKYKNFTLRLEQRVPIAWDDIDDLLQDQTGILIFVGSKGGPVRTWGDNLIEIEGKYHELLSISGLGALRLKATLDHDARRRVIKPVNQWQRIEVVSSGGTLKASLNGTLISTAELPADLDPGIIGLQSQGGPVEWRNIRLKEE